MPESEGGIYRELSAEMRDGLKNIYQQISCASAEGSVASADALFTEASSELKEVVAATESATMDIMEIVEKQLANAEKIRALLAQLEKNSENCPELGEIGRQNEELVVDLTSVLTALSFQDITGQRIKKVMSALNALEKSVIDLYLSSGLVIEAAERNPEADSEAIRAQAKKAMDDFRENRPVRSELKGPDNKGISQDSIDDMLAQLGL